MWGFESTALMFPISNKVSDISLCYLCISYISNYKQGLIAVDAEHFQFLIVPLLHFVLIFDLLRTILLNYFWAHLSNVKKISVKPAYKSHIWAVKIWLLYRGVSNIRSQTGLYTRIKSWKIGSYSRPTLIIGAFIVLLIYTAF